MGVIRSPHAFLGEWKIDEELSNSLNPNRKPPPSNFTFVTDYSQAVADEFLGLSDEDICVYQIGYGFAHENGEMHFPFHFALGVKNGVPALFWPYYDGGKFGASFIMLAQADEEASDKLFIGGKNDPNALMTAYKRRN